MSEPQLKTEYVRFDGEGDFQKSVDLLLEQPGRELRIFDPDLAALRGNRTHEEIRSLQDSFMALDAAHFLRRPVATHFRGALGLDDETEALAMRSRFQEIWGASFPGVSSTTLDL